MEVSNLKWNFGMISRTVMDGPYGLLYCIHLCYISLGASVLLVVALLSLYSFSSNHTLSVSCIEGIVIKRFLVRHELDQMYHNS